MTPILLDTHAAVWATSGNLRPAIQRSVDAAAREGRLLLSPISAWEIAMLVVRGRLKLSVPADAYVRELFALPGVVTAPLSPAIAAAAALFDRALHADPADRILAATAIAYGASLMTRDRRLHAFARETKSLRCIVC